MAAGIKKPGLNSIPVSFNLSCQSPKQWFWENVSQNRLNCGIRFYTVLLKNYFSVCQALFPFKNFKEIDSGR